MLSAVRGGGAAVLASAMALAVALTTPSSAQQDIPRNPDGTIAFRLIIDNSPIEMTYRPNQVLTDQVKQFHRTGKNPYTGDADAEAKGKAVYDRWCASCHQSDGSGKLGASLIDDIYQYPRVATDIGLFEITYAGGAGAMQAFGRRFDQDDVLKVMAYVGKLRGGK